MESRRLALDQYSARALAAWRLGETTYRRGLSEHASPLAQDQEAFDKVLLKVTKHLYRQFAKHPQVTDDFVVYIEDGDGGLDLIKRCVPAKLFKKHFEQYGEPKFDHLAPKARLDSYLEDMFTYEKEIVAMGTEAIGPLIKKLDDPEDGWLAASILADINQPSKEIIAALKKHMRSEDGSAHHCADALHFFGEVEFLFGLVKDKELQECAVGGILAGLKSRASNRQPHLPLNYTYVERLLAMKSPAIEEKVNEELRPGSCFIEIKASDTDEVLRGLSSPHVVIRQHAACVAGERSLGKSRRTENSAGAGGKAIRSGPQRSSPRTAGALLLESRRCALPRRNEEVAEG